MTQTVFEFSLQTLQGDPFPLANYHGQVLLIVNTASACGFTPQYEGLQALHERYEAAGLRVIGVPCNQFGGQEPGDAASIQTFCSTRYHVTFPLLQKVAVNGPQAEPLFTWLKQQAPGLLGSQAIKWNFTKFLVNRQGERVMRFAPQTSPAELANTIEEWLTAR
ncbi:glutathione peroxidase [Parvibium lacunae]|uniref:Glutathione peroxidase n=1 Tax=Parvibium lacunae TaxID=1888893 RepID=A0A368L3W3_9BURK|nr:glutathione peroxidase [Parvibium lacunae]RCS58254.1 glutathione peroxidase [Parvibium lacunae]